MMKVMRGGMLENAQIAATMDNEAALLWILGTKVTHIILSLLRSCYAFCTLTMLGILKCSLTLTSVVKIEKLLGLDRTALDQYISPHHNFFAAWAHRLFSFVPSHPHLTARLKQLLGNTGTVTMNTWHWLLSTHVSAIGNLLSVATGATKVRSLANPT